MLPKFQALSLTTKISLIATVILLAAIPVTVLSVNAIRDSRSKADCISNCSLPDPKVSWDKVPQFRIEVCLNTNQRGGAYCNANNFVDGNNQLTTKFLNNYLYYWFVDIKDISGNWVQYQMGNFTNTCFATSGVASPSLCDRTVFWDKPLFTAQATYHGVTPLRNACDGRPAGCVSSQSIVFPTESVQFVDLPPDIFIDTYVFVRGGSIPFTSVSNTPTGSAILQGAPGLISPIGNATGVPTNPTTFSWGKVDGAVSYTLMVSTGADFSFAGIWYQKVASAACASTCTIDWVGSNFQTQPGSSGPFPAPPAQLASGKPYFWSVWACTSSSCPGVGLAPVSGFTTVAAPVATLPKPSVGGLSDSDSQAQIPAGTWGSSHLFNFTVSGGTTYAVDISSDQCFCSGHFVNRSINVPYSTNLQTYTFGGDTGWNNQGSANYSSGGHLALDQNTTYYWRVFAGNSSGSVYNNQPWSVIKKPNLIVSTTQASVGGLKDSDSQLSIPTGSVWGNTHKFEWLGANATMFAVDISSDPNFASGHFVNKTINVAATNNLTSYSLLGDSGWSNQGTATYSSGGHLALDQNTVYYWRVYARNSAGNSIYSDRPWNAVSRPAINSIKLPNPATNLAVNYGGVTCATQGQNFGPTLSFTWGGTTAQYFAVDISINRDFSLGFTNKVILGGALSVTGNGGWHNNGYSSLADANGSLSLQPAKPYYWRVWATNGGTYSVYDVYYNSGNPAYAIRDACPDAITPVLMQPKPTADGSPTPDTKASPAFVWQAASAATAYRIGVSPNQTDLLNFRNSWYSTVMPSSCLLGICSKTWDVGGWVAIGGAPRQPLVLDSGRVYYWYVWACDSVSCPLQGLRQSSFRVSGDLQTPATNLSTDQATTGFTGLPHFFWTAALTTPKVDHYELLLKDSHIGTNFGEGGYWQQNLNPGDICDTPLPPVQSKCHSDLTKGSWNWVPGSTGVTSYKSYPPTPLYGGTFYWTIVACRSTSCPLSDVVVASIQSFSVQLGSGSGIFLSTAVGQCKPDKTVDVNLSWNQSSLAIDAQWAEISIYNNGFTTGYQSSPTVPVAGSNQKVSYNWTDLPGNGTTFRWQVVSAYNGYQYPSVTYIFTVPDCSAGGTGNYSELLSYIDSGTKGLYLGDGVTPLNYVIKTMMVHEDPQIVPQATDKSPLVRRNLGLCAVGTSGEIGILQYIAGTWKTLATNAGEFKPGADIGHGDYAYYTSGVNGAPLDGCWQIPGRDTHNQAYSYEELLGPNIDGGAWDPFSQIRTTVAAFKQNSHVGCNWTTYISSTLGS